MTQKQDSWSVKKRITTLKTGTLLILITVFLFLLFSIGLTQGAFARYSKTFSKSLGLIINRASQGIFIISAEGDSDSSYSYEGTEFTSDIVLSESDINSSKTFDLVLYNNTSSPQYLYSVDVASSDDGTDYTNPNIEFVCSGISSDTAIGSDEKLNVSISFRYSEEYKASVAALEFPPETLDNQLHSKIRFFFGYAIKYYLYNDYVDIDDCFIPVGGDLSDLEGDIPQRDGYNFMGWFDNPDYTKGKMYYDAEQKAKSLKDLNPDSNCISLYAGWQAYEDATTKIVFKLNNGTDNNASVISVKYGRDIVLPDQKATRTCFNFIKFNSEKDGSGEDYIPGQVFHNDLSVDRTITYYAQWDPIVYHIIIHPGEINGVPVSDSSVTLDVIYGDKVNLGKCYFDIPNNYIFSGHLTVKSNSSSWLTWNGTWTYNSGWDIDTVTNTLELYTIYEYGGYTLIYHANGGMGDDIIEEYYNGKSIHILGVDECPYTREGYNFKCWSVSPTGTKDEHGWTGWSGTWKYRNGQYGIANNQLHLYAVWEEVPQN